MNALPVFNDYLVFADEAGDHLLRPHYQDFPLFVLVFCIIERQHYANVVVPGMLRLKLKYFKDPHVVLHEREIRKGNGDFSFLANEKIRQEFCSDLNEFMSSTPYKVIASVIRKDVLAQQAPDTTHNIYELGTMFGLKRLLTFFDRQDQRLPATITFEARGRREDGDLCLSFLELMQQQKFSGRFDIKILPKIANCCGLQLADLIARPIGRHVLKPTQPNRAYEILRDKMDSYQGSIDGYGLEIFP